MWLFVSGGFLSIVGHRTLPDSLLVRARNPGHIHALFPEVELTFMPTADYPYRTVVSRTIVEGAIANYVRTMMYDNFKASIDDHEYHDVCLNVWHTMWVYGERHRNGGV